MKPDLERDLVVGISSRALFDLREEDWLFRTQGLAAYCKHQIAREDDLLQPGTGFALVQRLLRLNEVPGLAPRVVVILMSRNSADTSLRIFRSIAAHGLGITRGALTSGQPLSRYLRAFHVDLFLSAEDEDVRAAIAAGTAAARIHDAPTTAGREEAALRIAFDGDAVLFSEEAERVYQQQGLPAFQDHERRRASEPLPDGPFAGLFRALARIQTSLGDRPLLRTALVTARDAPAHERVIRTLRAWGVRVDEAFFLGGLAKHEVLEAFAPHIFFDDCPQHCEQAASRVPTARVPCALRDP